MQKQFLISLAGLIVICIGLGIALGWVASERRELKSLVAKQQDTLIYFRLETLGDSLLLAGNDSLAILTFARADSLFSQSDLTQRAEFFIRNRDSLRQNRREEFETLRRKMQQTLRSLLAREEDVRSRDNQLRDMNQEYELLQQELSALQKELEEKVRSIGKLEFKTSRGNSVYYVGDVKDGKANGYGSGSFSTGSIYVGTWKDNRKHGTGRYTWKDGSIYDGEYENDYRNGIGTYFFTTGEKYIGEWKNDKREGKGMLYDKNGKVVLEGIWKNDEFVR
ncbi:MAG: hypothetical protein ACK4XY_08075 [Chloroherpetonaceae bacterium]